MNYISLMKNEKRMCQYAHYKQYSNFLDMSDFTLCKRDSNDELLKMIYVKW